MVDLFYRQGAFNTQELKEFIEDYQKNGRHNWISKLKIGDDATHEIQKLVHLINKSYQSMGNLSDRLSLTIVELSKRKMQQHSGDCTIYASLANETSESGICACGYGLQVMRETGDNRELYSKELRDKLTRKRE